MVSKKFENQHHDVWLQRKQCGHFVGIHSEVMIVQLMCEVLKHVTLV
jgi:hypothetical protein